MEQFILKERLRSLIGEGRVKAALFYTFNFDPQFFENYIMPLLVPEQTFINNNIANNILWRRLYRDKKVPSITVYSDIYAKSYEKGPMLPYEIVEVNMPSLGKNKGNFHPKQSFILLEDKNGEEQFIIITGSNNIKQGGWCENKECISEHILINNKNFPEYFKKDIHDFISEVSQYNQTSSHSEAESLIIQFLNRKGTTSDKNFVFYHSFQMPFKEFLEEQILGFNNVNEVEIISPFFNTDLEMVNYLRGKGIAVKIEAPFRLDYCLLNEELFNSYKAAGVKWYEPIEERHVHSKVYRFYGDGIVYTIIGSVNFTAPAWCGVPEGKVKEVYNIESAILYAQTIEKRQYLLRRELKDELIKFREISEDPLENQFTHRISSPSLTFTIDWASSTIRWKGKLPNPCKLFLTESIQVELSNKGEQNLKELKHGKEITEGLARHTLLKVLEQVGEGTIEHFYYPNQEGFEQKPLEFRLSATDILDAWELLGFEKNEVLNEWLINRLEVYTDLFQDESGKIINNVTPSKSLLNEMARHLYGLVSLERFLFNESIFKKSRIHLKSHGNELRYYLLDDNVLALRSYLKDLEKLFHEDKLLAGYYWLLLSIIQSKFYENPLLQKIFKACIEEDSERKSFRLLLEGIKEEIKNSISELEKNLGVDRKKIKWATESLTIDYANIE